MKIEVEKEAGKIVKEVEKVGKVARTERFARFIRPIARMPRFVNAFAFHEKPTGRHHPHDKPDFKKRSKKRAKT